MLTLKISEVTARALKKWRAFVLLSLMALSVTPAAAWGDWEEYAVACSNASKPNAGRIIMYTKDGGNETQEPNPDIALVSFINRMISDGWQPIGGISYVGTSLGADLCQVIVKD